MTKKQKKEKKQIDRKKEQKEKIEKRTKEQEIELKEISLEELAEQPEQEIEADNFSEFMLSETSAEMPTLTLPSSPIPTPVDAGEENLEEIGRKARETSETGEIERREYVTIYNPPQYTAGTNEETILRNMEERGMTGRTVEELRHIRPRIMMEDWHEAGETRERAREMSGDYLVVETERREEEKRLPIEQKRKYRELKK